MSAYEIILSESQERMLVVPKKGAEDEVKRIFAKWGLEAVVVGRVTDDGMLRIKEGDQVVAEVPAKSLSTDGAPSYRPEERRPAYIDELVNAPIPDDIEGDAGQILKTLLSDPNIANKAWVYRQFDHMVQTRTAVPPGVADAAVLRLRESGKGLAMSIDCNALHCYVDPKTGAAAAVAEAARNLVCTGARPLALTDGMNFGNPEKPEVYWQLHRSVEGIAMAARALGTPVTGGNVSLYNESEGSAIPPTPIIGMVGLLERDEARLTQGFKEPGDIVYLLGEHCGELGGSRYLKALHDVIKGPLPPLDLELERRVQEACLAAAGKGYLKSAHDCSEGGLAVALAESCLTGRLGVRVQWEPAAGLRLDAQLFGEGYSRIVVTVAPSDVEAFESLLADAGVPWSRIGVVTALEDGYALEVGGVRIKEGLADLADCWYGSLPRAMDGAEAASGFVPPALARA